MNKKALFSLSLFMLFFVSSCKNFFGGKEIMNQIEDSLDFLSAPYIKVTISANNQATQAISPAIGSYTDKYKNTSNITLSFEETEKYQFTNWVVEPEGAVDFKDPDAKSTTGILNTKANQINIYPKTYERPNFEISPSNLVVSPKNTSIAISFDHKMEISDEQLNSIDIQISNLSIRKIFDCNVTDINGKTIITFKPQSSAINTLEASTVNVIVPAGFYYLTPENKKISTIEETVYAFKINNETIEKANISISSSEGTLSYSGTNDYSLGNEITVSFTPSIEYEIDHWEAFYTNNPNNIVNPNIILLVPDEEDMYTVTATILSGSNEPIILKPVCIYRNYIQASFITEHGYISPSESKKIYSGQSLPVSYRQDTDYAFLNWEVLNENNIPITPEEYTDIFDFESSNMESEITVKDIQNIYTYKFVAKCVERPQILSTTPLYSADGTYRDTRIQVMFDNDMSENSIYYTSTEREQIKKANNITDDDFLHTGEKEEDYKYYGYVVNDEIFYKNISIINYKTKKNILENFDPPYFETKTILVIPTNNIKPPAAGTQVFVTINSEFFYNQDTVPIYLASSKKWNYLVNTRIDTNPPELTVVSFKKTLIDDTHKVFDTTSITNNEPEPFEDNDSKSQNFTKVDKLELALKLEDLGSGPASISMDIINISNKTRIENINIPIEIYGTEGFYGQYSDSDLLGIPLNLFDYVDDSSDINGTIAIRFKGTDLKNNPKYSDYYVFYSDTIPPQLPNKPEISSNENKINISWENPSDSDFDKVIIEYMEKGSSDKTTIDSLNNTNISEELSLINGKTYDVSLYPIDKFGNVGTVYSRTISTMPGTPEITTQLESSQLVNSVTLNWNKPEGNYSKAELYCYKLVNSTPTLLSSYETESPDETSYTFTNLPYGEMCSFSIYAYDSENQRSTKSANINTFVLPEPATSVTAETISVSQIKVSWTNPTNTNSSYTGYKLYYKSKSAEDWSSITLPKIFSSYTVLGLEMGTDYDFELKRYATFQTTRTFESTGLTTSAATKAGSVYNLKADSITEDSINLSWENIAAENYDTILIEYKASSDANYESITLEKGTESYLYEDLTAGSTYIFNVYAVRSNAKGISSTYICDTKPNPITNLQYDSTYTKTTSSFRVKWTNPTSGKTNGTKIYYSTSDETPNESTPYIIASKTSTDINITELTAGTKYYIKAVSLSELQEQESEISSTEAATKTETVTKLSISQTLNGNYRNISLSWTAPSGNYTGFTVYYGTTNPPTSYTTVSTNSCSLANLTAGKKYFIYVRTNNSSTSEYVDSSLTTFITTPNKVTSLTSTPISTSKISLSWANPSSGSIEGIRIYRKTGSGTYEKLTDVPKGSKYYEDSYYEDSYSLTAGTTYTYKVVPYVTNGTTTIENTDLVTTTNAPKPNPVTNLQVSTTSTTSQAKVSWSYPTTGAYTGAIVYYKLSTATSYTKYTTVSKSYSYSYISNLTPGQKYNFKVVTYTNNDQNNVSSDTISSILSLYPNSVTNLSASETSNSVKLTWTKPSGYILSYNIYKKTYSGSYTLVDSCRNTDTSYTVTGLNSGTKYTFKVVTLGLEGTRQAIAEVSRYTKPSAPTNASVYCDDGQGRIKLKWTQPSGDAFDDVDVYVGTSKVGTVTTSTATAGTTTYLFVDIPNFSRSSSYSFTLKPYIKQVDGNYGIGDVYTISGYYNSTGDLKINGTTYSYTRLKNVITSQTSINANTTLTDGAFTKNRYITLSPYSIGAYEVTNELYYAVTGTTPSTSHTAWNYPVENMNWYQALWFCNKLSNIMGFTPVYKIYGYDISTYETYSNVPKDSNDSWSKNITYDMSASGYRLPTEAEWEFAARGGSTTVTAWGYKYSGSNTLNNVGWNSDNAGGSTHPVGQKTDNRLGLYDMSGNVWEWLTDWNNNVPDGTFTNPVISYSSSYKSQNEILQKGGSWNNTTNCAVDYNSTHETPGSEDNRTGLRIMRRKTCSN